MKDARHYVSLFVQESMKFVEPKIEYYKDSNDIWQLLTSFSKNKYKSELRKISLKGNDKTGFINTTLQPEKEVVVSSSKAKNIDEAHDLAKKSLKIQHVVWSDSIDDVV